MKKLARRRFLAATRAGLVGLRPRPQARGGQGSPAARDAPRSGRSLPQTDACGVYTRAVYAAGDAAPARAPTGDADTSGCDAEVRVRAADGTGVGAVATFTYDMEGELLSAGQASPGRPFDCALVSPGAAGLTWYDAAGRITRVVDPPGRVTTFLYDGEGLRRPGR